MLKLIMKKLDKWADSKTQEEFNDFINNWIVFPLFILIALAIMTADSWPI